MGAIFKCWFLNVREHFLNIRQDIQGYFTKYFSFKVITVKRMGPIMSLLLGAMGPIMNLLLGAI